MQKWKLVSEGKVRKIYENSYGNRVLLVAGDGVSAFDNKLGVSIPGKGRMLTEISKYWFNKTRYTAPNAYYGIGNLLQSELDELKDMGIDAQASTMMMKLDMLPVECIVRGYITGSAWSAYEKGERMICGIPLPDGLQNSERLKKPIFTPTTKAPEGQHDENLSLNEMITHLRSHGIADATDIAMAMLRYSLSLFEKASEMLLSKGIILADTKFEFGIDPSNDLIMVGDEIFTPDSSRFWSVDDYEVGRPQKSLDKQVIRDWVKAHPGEKVSDEVLLEAGDLYRKITDIITNE